MYDLSEIFTRWTVLSSNVAVPAGQITPIVQANPMRWALYLKSAGAGTVNIGLDNNITGPTSPWMLANGEMIPTAFRFRDDGILCGSAWYGFSPAPGNSVWVVQLIWKQ